MDRLEHISQNLITALEREADSRPVSCLGIEDLAAYAAGGLDGSARRLADAHLEECLVCLNELIDLRDCLSAVLTPPIPSRRLRQHVQDIVAVRGLAMRLRRMMVAALGYRMPIGWPLGFAATSLLLLWLGGHVFREINPASSHRTEIQPSARKPADGLSTMYPLSQSQVLRFTGEVTSVRSEGYGPPLQEQKSLHILELRTPGNTQYEIVCLDKPAVRPGDFIEVEGVFGKVKGSRDVYRGIATRIQPGRK